MAKARSSSLRRRASTGSFINPARNVNLACGQQHVSGKPPRKTSAGFLSHMAEGRKCQVMLQDDRRLHFLIQPKLLVSDLLDMVASHFTLKEKEFFGLAFQDDSGHLNWLQNDRRVLEHDYPKKTGPLLLHFQVKFFIESIAYLRDNATIEVFYLQAKQQIYKGTVEADSDTIFELAAHVLQESHGNYEDDDATRSDLRKLPVLPIRTLKEHPSLSYCEDEILNHYKKLSGLSRGSAIVNYMTIAESLPTYGIHTYEVKDKSGLPWWIGLSYKGIAQYDFNDKKTPRRVFPWKQLENLYFRDKKFSIEVLDPKRIVHALSTYNLYEEAIREPLEQYDQLTDDITDPTTQVSVSRRTFGPSNVNVFAWFTSTPVLAKCIWSMAVSQHQFYLDRKQSKSHIPAVRSMSEIAADLSQSTPSLPGSMGGSDNLSQCSSTASLQHHGGGQYRGGTLPRHSDVSQEDIEEIRAAQKEMYQALKARKEALEAALQKKNEELKLMCMKEAELTGELPKETPLAPGEPIPQIRRRMGTAFSLSPKVVDREHRSQDEEYISKLELEYELQKQICHAAQKLAQDTRLNKKARKQRKTQYINAHLKLKTLERKLKEAIEHARRFRSQSQDDLDNIPITDSETEFTPGHSPALKRRGPENESKSSLESAEPSRPSTLHREGVPSTSSSQCSLPEFSSPHSPHKHLSRESSPSPNRPAPVGYVPSSVYTTRTQYRNQTYPTFGIRSHSLSSTHSDYDSTGSVNQSRSDVNHSRSDVSTSRNDVSTSRNSLRQDLTYEQRLAEVAQNYYGTHGNGIGTHGNTRSHSNEDTRAPIINPYVTVETNQDYRYRPDEDRLQNIGHTGSLDKIYRRRRNSSDSRSSDDRRYGSLERNFTYQRGANSEYVGQYEITHIEEGEPDSQDYYQASVPLGVQDSVASPVPVHPGAGDMAHRPRFYIDDQDQVTVQGESFTTVTQYPHFREESKPFEMSDFYQYSEKLRKQRQEKGRTSPALSHSSSASGDRCLPQYAHSIRVGALSPGMEYAYPVQGSPQVARSPYDSPQTVRSRRLDSDDAERPRTPREQVLLGQAMGGLSASPYSSPRISPRAASPLHPRSRDASFTLEPPNLAASFSREMYEWYQQDQQDESLSSSLV